MIVNNRNIGIDSADVQRCKDIETLYQWRDMIKFDMDSLYEKAKQDSHYKKAARLQELLYDQLNSRIRVLRIKHSEEKNKRIVKALFDCVPEDIRTDILKKVC